MIIMIVMVTHNDDNDMMMMMRMRMTTKTIRDVINKSRIKVNVVIACRQSWLLNKVKHIAVKCINNKSILH